MAKPILEQLQKFGRTHRGWLGVKIQEVNDEIANSLGLKDNSGALVLEINPKSPAAKGLEVGDVITRFDGKPVKEMRQLPRMVAQTQVGRKVELGVWRKGRELSLPITLGELPQDGKSAAKKTLRTDEPEATPGANVLGMNVAPITAQTRAQFGLPKSAEGLLVLELQRSGDAAKNGMLPGDIIREVNQQPVTSVEAFKKALQDAKRAGKKFALLRVQRRDGGQFITVPVK
jgi:serine protease Do